jgi:hypothetical protein
MSGCRRHALTGIDPAKNVRIQIVRLWVVPLNQFLSLSNACMPGFDLGGVAEIMSNMHDRPVLQFTSPFDTSPKRVDAQTGPAHPCRLGLHLSM